MATPARWRRQTGNWTRWKLTWPWPAAGSSTGGSWSSETQIPGRPPEDPRELALFERAAQLYRVLGDLGGEAGSLFWIGCFHQVVRRDDGTAVPPSNDPASSRSGPGTR